MLPRRANRRLLIYHHGHHETFRHGKPIVAYYLERGYALLLFSMPYAGLQLHARHGRDAEMRARRPGADGIAINNVYDPCCYSGRSFEERPRVQAALRRLGTGAFDAVGDTTHREHRFSRFTADLIEADLERG